MRCINHVFSMVLETQHNPFVMPPDLGHTYKRNLINIGQHMLCKALPHNPRSRAILSRLGTILGPCGDLGAMLGRLGSILAPSRTV